MRFRLRTLLIAVTLAATCFAWVGYAKKMASFHRGQAALIARRIAVVERDTQKEVELGILSLAAGHSTTMTRRLSNGSTRITTIKNGPTARVIADESEVDWRTAIQHTMTAHAYDRAALRPWEFIRLKKAP